MFYEKGRKSWRVMWTEGGKRRSRRFASEKEAARFEKMLELGLVEKTERTYSPTFQDFTERWLKEYCQVEKAPSAWGKDRQIISHHLIPAFGDVRMTMLGKVHLQSLKVSLRELKPNTVNNILALAKKIVATAVDWGVIPVHPWLTVKRLKVPDRTFDYWTTAELSAFCEGAMAIDPDFTRLVITAFHTGLRAGELAALLREDLEFERGQGQIRVRATVDLNTGERYETTKNRRVQYVPMNQAVREALEPARFLSPRAQVFNSAMFWSVRKKFGRLAKKVGARPIRFHDLRHSFASNLAMAGMDLMQIQKLMRHQSYQMTLRYAHLHPDHLKGATEILCTPTAPKSDFGGKSGAPRGT